MPQRKKSDLSQRSRAARRSRRKRSQMSAENHEARLTAARERQARVLASESPIEREIRLSKDRARSAASRLMENGKKRKALLATNRLRLRLPRKFETFAERKSLLSSQRAPTAAAQMLKRMQKAQYQASPIIFNQEDCKESFTSACYVPQDSTNFDTPETAQEFNDGSAIDTIKDASIDYNFSRDQYSIYGEIIAHRLRNCQRNNNEISIAQHYIDEIMFKLSMGCYSPINAQLSHPVPSSSSATSSCSISIPSTSMPNISMYTTFVPDASTPIPTAHHLESEPLQCIILKKELDL